MLSSCIPFQEKGTISTPSGSVSATKDAGKPATLDTNTKTEEITLPPHSVVTTTKLAASPAFAKTDLTPAVAAQPEREITVVTIPSEAKWQKISTQLSANTGTTDTSIAKAKIDAEESRILLYASIASAVAAGFFVYRAYPTPAISCGTGSVVFFLAWKMTGLPDWFWAIGALGIAGAIFLYIGHERGLNSNKNASPSIIS